VVNYRTYFYWKEILMHWYGHGLGWGGMVFGGIMMLLFWGGLIALIFWTVKSFASRSVERAEEYRPSAREILDRRYAQGEINRDEYERMKEDLKQY
jgi:putative membrane protein